MVPSDVHSADEAVFCFLPCPLSLAGARDSSRARLPDTAYQQLTCAHSRIIKHETLVRVRESVCYTCRFQRSYCVSLRHSVTGLWQGLSSPPGIPRRRPRVLSWFWPSIPLRRPLRTPFWCVTFPPLASDPSDCRPRGPPCPWLGRGEKFGLFEGQKRHLAFSKYAF